MRHPERDFKARHGPQGLLVVPYIEEKRFWWRTSRLFWKGPLVVHLEQIELNDCD